MNFLLGQQKETFEKHGIGYVEVRKFSYWNPLQLERGSLQTQIKNLPFYVLYVEGMSIQSMLAHTKSLNQGTEHEMVG